MSSPIRKIVLVALVLTGIADVSASEEVALNLVRKLNMGSNLVDIGEQAARLSVTFDIMVREVGETRTLAIIRNELKRVRPEFQDEWNKNLAASYAELYTTEELESMYALEGKSPYVLRFAMSKSKVGELMRSRSSDLLAAYVSKVMTEAFKKAGEPTNNQTQNGT